MAEVEGQGIWPDPMVTEVAPFQAFHPAEDYHSDYFARNPGQAYCRAVISPKLAKFRARFADKLKGGMGEGSGS